MEANAMEERFFIYRSFEQQICVLILSDSGVLNLLISVGAKFWPVRDNFSDQSDQSGITQVRGATEQNLFSMEFKIPQVLCSADNLGIFLFELLDFLIITIFYRVAEFKV